MAKLDYVFKIRNNPIGKLFMWYFKRILNTDTYSVVRRGRNENRTKVFKKNNYRPNYCKDVPINMASYYAIYLNRKDERKYL